MSETKKQILASPDYLKKLFIMPDSPDKFIEFGHQLLEMIHEFFTKKGGIHSSITLPELSKIFNQIDLPEKPHLIKDVLAEIKEKVIAHSVKVASPYYIGHMISAQPYFMILLEMIIAALNQNQVKIETAKASSFVERELVAWLHRMVFNRRQQFYERNMQNPKVALGNVTVDGTIANLTALLVAREKAFPANGKFQGPRYNGMECALKHYGYKRGVILVSTRGHYSIRKSANLLGIGEENVITIPVDEFQRMDIKKLQKKVQQLSKRTRERAKIIAIIGIVGSTETGNIDDLSAIGEIARSVGAHFHVDACWGGAVLLSNEYRASLKGIEQADSVSIDAHKLLYCPMSMGVILFRSERDLNYIKHSSQYIIRRNSVDTGRFTIEGSRPFACLKLWASLKIFGKEGYNIIFQKASSSTKSFIDILNSSEHFETLNFPELFIVIYRFIPKEVKDKLNSLISQIERYKKNSSLKRELQERVKKINHLINGLNIKLHKALRLDDTTFVSRTKIESTRYRPQWIVVLRAVLINPLLEKEILEEIVQTQSRLGLRIWKEFQSAYVKIVSS